MKYIELLFLILIKQKPDSADLQSEPLTIFSPKIMKYIKSLFLILIKQNHVGYLYLGTDCKSALSGQS